MNVFDFETISKNPYTRLVVSKKCLPHRHTFFEFSICISGQVKNCINGVDYEITKGTVVLLRPQDEHCFISTDGHISRDVYVSTELLKSVCDCIDPDLFQKIQDEPMAMFFKISDYDLQMLENKLNVFNGVRDLSLQQSRAAHINAVTELFTLWQQSLRPQKKLPNWIISLTKQLNNAGFKKKSLDEIIQATHYSHGYVCREFKKYMGVTLQEYISSVKFSYAIALLQAQENTIEQIAFKLNYSSASIFIAAFKRKYGLSPAQWRKAQQSSALSNKILIQ